LPFSFSSRCCGFFTIYDLPEVDFITKARKDENAKEKKNSVLSPLEACVFVINCFWFSDRRELRFSPTGLPGSG
jgi:hypothetical protein